MRHRFSLVLIAWLAGGLGFTIAAGPSAPRPPNVVVFLADDAGYGDFSFTGNTNVSTPAIDSLARDGAVLRQFMVQPFCSPTRAEFLTGRAYPRTGVRGVSTGQERMAADERTIANVFRDAGHATGCFGKWHNGTQWPWHPRARGFDTFRGFTEGHWGDSFDPPLEHDGEFVRGTGFIADDLTTAAIEFVRRTHAAGRPFFCYVPFNTPHSPMSVPDADWAPVRDRPIGMRGPGDAGANIDFTRAALAMVENLDRNVGRVLAEIDRLGAARDTIVVLFSDNGPNSPRWNAGLRGVKGSTDDGGVRSGCCIRFPAAIAGGTVVTEVTGAIDLLPTLAGLAGIPVAASKPLDGIDLAPLLSGKPDAAAAAGGRAIISRNGPKVSARTTRYRLDAEGRLYDMAADPGQTRDVAAEQPAEAARLREVVAAYRRDVIESDPGTATEPFTVGHPGAPLTELPARDGIPRGGVRRNNKHANCTFFTSWTSPEDAIEWKVDVATAGGYDVELWYTCPEADAGSTVEVSCGTAVTTGTITPGWDPPLNEGDDRVARGEGYDKDFRRLRLGRIDLTAGPATLRLRATQIPAASVADLRRVVLVPATAATAASADTTAAGGEPVPNTLTEAERRTGWRLLFDGRSAAAFRGFRQESIGPGWAIEDGTLVRKGRGAGDIVTRQTFAGFELQLEYRIAPGGNSGLMFHVTEEEPKPWMTGPEVQILDSAAGKDPQKAGWLYQLYQPKPRAVSAVPTTGTSAPRLEVFDATRPAGEWNQIYLRVLPDSGEVCMNGVSYFKFRKGDKEWDERVAKSKFAKFPSFGRADRGHICLQDHGDEVAFRSIKIRELSPETPVTAAEDGTLPVKLVPAFPGMEWEGWNPETEDGKPAVPLRPLLVTHAGDGSGRRFVLDQAGMIHVVPRDPAPAAPAGGKEPGTPAGNGPRAKARLFLDIRERATPWGKSSEEGLLGLAFHPRFRENGQFFVCYCLSGTPRIERVSRFRVLADDPNRADPDSEEVLLTIEQPLPNHNGGSIAFGPDGCLYVGIGDGGGRDDPLQSAQRLDTMLGKILRIAVDRRDPGRAYAVPADNPFVGRAGALPEIFAFGFRNPWQISFDRLTGRLWAADVGQDLREEIDVVVRGGNYGWSLREGTGSFGPRTTREPTVAPVWEYDHQVGKSITGGSVARGAAVPALEGFYLYGDYVSGRLWGLRADTAAGRPANMVNMSNMAIPGTGEWASRPVFGFGQDEAGEVYVVTSSPTGQGVFRLVPDDAAAGSRPLTSP